MEKLENRDIICIAGVDFEPLWARTQQLVWRLPESNRVLYVEEPISILAPFKDPSRWYKWKLWREGIRPKKTNLFLFSPPLLLPFANRYRFINRINQWLMSKSLKKICHQLNFRHPILLTYLPNTADLVGKLGEELLIYDCVDEHAAFLGFNADLVTRMEIDLIKQADLVFATALPLYEDKKRYTDQIHLLRNAADVEHFNKADDEATPIPEDVVHIKAPVLGFIGRIKEWIDLELIRQVAEARPEWSIIMVGPVELDADISAFSNLPNVYFVGSKTKEELPAYLKKFDVCLNPFRAGKLSKAVNPLKLYEYLSAGKPVVSTPMPELEALGGLVEIGHDLDGFIKAIERSLNDSPRKKQERLDFARDNSWDSRVKELCSKIGNLL
jgi:glycosyltransferase involved in cell wall biosynthesis